MMNESVSLKIEQDDLLRLSMYIGYWKNIVKLGETHNSLEDLERTIETSYWANSNVVRLTPLQAIILKLVIQVVQKERQGFDSLLLQLEAVKPDRGTRVEFKLAELGIDPTGILPIIAREIIRYWLSWALSLLGLTICIYATSLPELVYWFPYLSSYTIGFYLLLLGPISYLNRRRLSTKEIILSWILLSTSVITGSASRLLSYLEDPLLPLQRLVDMSVFLTGYVNLLTFLIVAFLGRVFYPVLTTIFGKFLGIFLFFWDKVNLRSNGAYELSYPVAVLKLPFSQKLISLLLSSIMIYLNIALFYEKVFFTQISLEISVFLSMIIVPSIVFPFLTLCIARATIGEREIKPDLLFKAASVLTILSLAFRLTMLNTRLVFLNFLNLGSLVIAQVLGYLAVHHDILKDLTAT